MSRFVKQLREVDITCLREVGGKGAHLGEMIGAGFPVPDGFCVLASAYDRFFAVNNLAEAAQDRLPQMDLSDLSGLEKRAKRFQETFLEAPMPLDLAEEIRGAYQSLCHDSGNDDLRVAVRSSVAALDLSRTSFPGQMDTYHNIFGEEEVLYFVKKCWASLWNFSAIVYRLSHGIGPFDVFIAPVVQMMIPSDIAGVLFTINPVTHNDDEMVLNACFGLGEAVVSGRFAVDHFVIKKEPPSVLEQKIGVKERKLELKGASAQGTVVVQVDPEQASKPCLSWDQIQTLIKLSKDLECHFKKPLDIEWAFADSSFYILQARLVQASVSADKSQRKSSEPEGWVSEFDTPVDPKYPRYTASNISEVLPGVLTPLTLGYLDVLEYGFQAANMALGALSKKDVGGRRFFYLASFYGRAFLNLSAFVEIIARVPGASASEFERDSLDERAATPAKGSSKLTLASVFRLIKVIIGFYSRMRRVPMEAELYRKQIEAYRRQLLCEDRSQWPLQKYHQLLESRRDTSYQVMRVHIEASQFAVVFYETLQKLTAKWFGDSRGNLAAKLVTGLTTVESAQPGFGIWALSRIVMQSPTLKAIFENNDPVEIQKKIDEQDSEGIHRFKEELNAFQTRYGYRSVLEAELMLPSWEEDTGFVFSIIKNYLHQDEYNNPQAVQGRQERERKEIVQKTLGRLPYFRRRIFQWALKQAQQYIALREFMKATLVMDIGGHKKIIFRDISRHLNKMGIIKEPNDLYFLTDQEILEILTGKRPDEYLLKKISKRKEEYEKNKKVTLPENFEGRPKPIVLQETATEPEEITTLKGIPVSPGKVKGRARVICDPRKVAVIEPGEILVAPVTDAGWAPLFISAAGIVVDVGGLLSHGSIVAREYGIPGVLNVKRATAVIKSGQEILVDGDLGEVKILKD